MIQDSIQVLQAQGHKVTKPRLQVIEILSNAKKPASAYEIQDLLRQQGKYLNHVTIYRVLELLCHLKLAHILPSEKSFTKCTLGNREGCHRFMICHNCGTIKEYVDELISSGEKSTKPLRESDKIREISFIFSSPEFFRTTSFILSVPVANAKSSTDGSNFNIFVFEETLSPDDGLT